MHIIMLLRGKIFFWLMLNILKCRHYQTQGKLFVPFAPGIVSLIVDAIEILLLFLPPLELRLFYSCLHAS